MGKFLRDKDGNFVAIDGAMVLEKTLDRKPRDCEQCGFNKWVKKDKIFIIQKSGGGGSMPVSKNHRILSAPSSFGGGMEWICPDCALQRGLPAEHYHKNFYATPSTEAIQLLQNHQQRQPQNGGVGCESAGWNNFLDLTGFMCSG
jgi:hypothetical protein